ncbi:MAG: succinate dehydrogenase cytochrome b subunit [Gemmatimonadetes bacterium]|nr:succinate dehydrogenase cytochrome b subunit [Gemmatimonadota bacterium]
MRPVLRFYSTSIGKKAVMAVTGLILFGFVAGHLVGNLKVFTGAEKFNAYAEFLREAGAPLFGHGELLWVARIGLLIALVLHVVAALQLVLLARRARPARYRRGVHLEDTFASRTMRSGGIVIFVFVLYHLMHLTWGNAHPAFVAGDPYANLVRGFQSVGVSIGYIVAVSVVGLHIYHGIWSSLQTLGINQERHTRWRKASAVIAALIVLGNVSIPVAVLTGMVR